MSIFAISIDERMRLVTAVLAASDWPDEEQKQQPHAVHSQAKQVRQFVQPFRSHPAVNGVNEALLNGVELEELFSAALRSTWPDFTPTTELPHLLKINEWVRSLADFASATSIMTLFWSQHTAVWQEAQAALEKIFAGDGLLKCLAQLHDGEIETAVTLMPNLVYPALTPVVATTDDELLLLLPPPKAVGESPPWPYDEGPGWVMATVCRQLIPYLLVTELAQMNRREQHLALHTAAAYCLAQLMDESEAQAYLLRTKKAHDMPELPTLFAQLQAEIESGNGRPLASLFEK